MLVAAFDPGAGGGLCVLDRGGVLKLETMPTVANAIDPKSLCLMLREFVGKDIRVFIEKAQAMPKQGVSSTFRYGVGFGYLEMLCVALGFTYELVTPQRWQKTMFVGTETSMPSKARALIAAKRIAPSDCTFLATPRSKKPHEGLVDAYLIAAYGLKQMLGEKVA